MNFSRCFCLVAFAFLSGIGFAAEQAREIRVEGLTEQSLVAFSQGTYWGTNGIIIRYTNAVLTAQSASVNPESGEAQAQGEVTLQRGAELWRGERLSYNFKTHEMQADRFRTGHIPFFVSGEGLSVNTTNRNSVLREASLTTDDVANPAYSIRAQSITLIEGERLEARNATIYIGNVPVMFFPYYSRSLRGHSNFWVLTPGYRSSYGPFLLTSYHWTWNTNLSGAFNFDYRLKRGVGVGPDLEWNLGRGGKGDASFYYTPDNDPGKDPDGNPIRSDRHRISFSHQATIRTNLTAKIVVREQTDAQFTRDFFETEYHQNPQPKSFLEINQLWPNWSLDFLAQPQIDDFFQTVERLPDVKLSGIRQQLGVSPFFYESESSAGYFRFQSAEDSGLDSFAAVRADTFHQILLPQTFFGWLNFTPRVGGRFTHYGETEGEGTTFDEQNRSVFNTGAEISFKASRIWPGARSKLFEVDGIRHIVEPSFNYVFVPEPSRVPSELPQFDTAIPMLHLLPADFPDYNAIDAIDSQNVFRLGLRNKVQTKRAGEIQNLVNWALLVDWRLDPQHGQTRFSDLYSQIDLSPRSWLNLSSELRYDVEHSRARYAESHITLTPNDRWSWSLGHLYFREDAAFGTNSGNNLFRNSISYRLNENWGFRMTHHFEARDGTMEDQYYTIYRDMRSWTSALTLRLRKNREGQDDFTIAVMFSLKAIPRFRLGQDRDHHSVLVGG